MLEGKDLKTISKILRRRSTPWERKLWYYLRANRFYGLKFKRQVPIGSYVVDFCCQGKRLIIELDGGHHSQSEVKNADKERQLFLENNGYKVLRFWNNDLDSNIDGVLEIIRKEIFK